MRVLPLVTLLAVLLLPVAHATSSFGYSGNGLMVQFVGDGDFSPEFRGYIEISGKTGSGAVPSETYTLTNYVYRKSLRLEFVNPGDKALPPSFVLTVCGEKATVVTGDKTFMGHFSWES